MKKSRMKQEKFLNVRRWEFLLRMLGRFSLSDTAVMRQYRPHYKEGETWQKCG